MARKWIWFRHDLKGHSLAKDEFDALDVDGRAGLSKTMQRYRDRMTRAGGVDSIGDGIFELRYRRDQVCFRLLFMDCGQHLVALAAFQNDRPETEEPDLDSARNRAGRWRQVFRDRPLDSPAFTGSEDLDGLRPARHLTNIGCNRYSVHLVPRGEAGSGWELT